MNSKKSENLIESANILTALRLGDIQYDKIKKRDLWNLLNLLIERPALGMADTGDQDSFKAESKRIFSVCLSPDGVNPADSISIIGGSLNYDTLLVLNQMMHQHIACLADARKIIYDRPGEVEDLTQRISDLIEKTKETGIPLDMKVERIDIFLSTFLELFQYVLHMANSADIILSLINDKKSD